MPDHAVSLEMVTLGLMIIATILTVFTGWNKATERITRVEERLNTLLRLVSPKRRSGDSQDSDDSDMD